MTSTMQEQTKEAFGFKWSKRDTYESEAVHKAHYAWLIQRYCNNDPKMLDKWLAGGRKTILDAGCGAGWSGFIFFGDYIKDHDYIGLDISSAAQVAEQRFKEKGLPARFIQADLVNAPIEDESVDLIFSEGVLHHTDNTENAICRLAKKAKIGGRFMFYVYVKKSPGREFTDDWVRNQLLPLDDETAWERLKPLTSLGIELGRLNVTVDVPEDVPMLGIKKGPIDVQRLFYWHFCKMYYRPEYSFDENHHINFDWYRPINCHRHTPEEVRRYCERAGLEIEHMDVQESGITVVSRRIK
jgi:arsenite methyltransferase